VFAHSHAFANALARGDRAAVDEAAEAAERAAMALGHPMHRGHVAAALAARALWLGDLLLAEQFSEEATRCLGDHRSRELAFLVATAQRFVLRRFQGRLAELEPQLDAGLRDHPERLWFQCALGLLYATTGRDDAARASLARVAERRTDGRQIRLPAELARSTNVALLAETCAYLRDAETAAALELELEIAGDGNVCLGAITCVGSIQRYRGLVAHARGDHDEAIAFLEDAIEWEKHVGARALEAFAVVDCARVALVRGAPGDDEIVRAHAARAAQLAAEQSMPSILAAARELAYAR
jgi:tetratricopeptide (TPR) repeat protein